MKFMLLIGAVVYLAQYGLGAVLFPKTSWREDDPCERS